LQLLGGAEVAELNKVRSGVAQDVGGLDVPMADSDRVDVCQAAKQLV